MDWEPAEKVQKNDAGEYRANIGGQWVPVVRAQKNDEGQYRVIRAEAPAGTPTPSAGPIDAEPTKPMWQRMLNPVLETVLPVGGAIIGGGAGTFAMPGPGTIAGGVAGGGLGYAAAKEIEKNIENYMGQRKSQGVVEESLDAAKNTLIGAAFESGGRVLLPPLATAAGWVWDAAKGRLAQVKAGKIVQELAGPQLEALRAASAANRNATAGQAASGVYVPPIQTLAKQTAEKTPYTQGRVAADEATAAEVQLGELAGGASQTEAKVAQNDARLNLNNQLIPVLENNLNTANIAGRELPRLQGEADRFNAAAANKVEDVRRMLSERSDKLGAETPAGVKQRAAERANTTQTVVGQPRVPGRYTYMGELEQKAEQVAETAARGSLTFGEAGRFAQAGADSLVAHGLAPLKTAPTIASILETAKDPTHAGNNLLESALANVANDIAKWTNKGGVIDAWALDSIRKNSVNAAVQRLLPGTDKAAQRDAAAGVMIEIKPMIIKAIEDAGGKGYGQYLADYSAGRQLIGQQKLGATALDLYKNSPKEFVSLVEGNSPEKVEKIFGKGSYNIAKEMSAQAMETLRGVANQVSRTAEMARQAKIGSVAYKEALKKATQGIPRVNMLSRKTMLANEAIDLLEGKINKNVMNALVKGMESGKGLNELLNIVPSSQKNTVLNVLRTIRGGQSAATFALTPSIDNEGAVR